MSNPKEPECSCSGGPGCQHDARVPPMPLFLMGLREPPSPTSPPPLESLSSSSSSESFNDEDTEAPPPPPRNQQQHQQQRLEPLVAFHRKMARQAGIAARPKNGSRVTSYKDARDRAAQLCPCRLVEEVPSVSAEERLTKRLAVVFFMARYRKKWQKKKTSKDRNDPNGVDHSDKSEDGEAKTD